MNFKYFIILLVVIFAHVATASRVIPTCKGTFGGECRNGLNCPDNMRNEGKQDCGRGSSCCSKKCT